MAARGVLSEDTDGRFALYADVAPSVGGRPHKEEIMAEIKYKRVVIKLSGEALAGANGSGIDHAKLAKVSEQIVEVKNMGAQVGVVIEIGRAHV